MDECDNYKIDEKLEVHYHIPQSGTIRRSGCQDDETCRIYWISRT